MRFRESADKNLGQESVYDPTGRWSVGSQVNLNSHRHEITLGEVLLPPHPGLHGEDVRGRFAIREDGCFPRRRADRHGCRYRSPPAPPSFRRIPDLLCPGRRKRDEMPSPGALVEPQSRPYVHPQHRHTTAFFQPPRVKSQSVNNPTPVSEIMIAQNTP